MVKIKDRWDYEEDKKKGKLNGWYKLPGIDGPNYILYKNGKFKAGVYISEVDLDKNRRYEVWVGDDSGESETISYHRYPSKAEDSAERWIKKHPKGEI